jgi:hypothetical protein
MSVFQTASTWTLVVGAATACASAPPVPGPEPETRVAVTSVPGAMGGMRLYTEPGVGARRVDAPVDSVWLVMPRVYELLEIPDAGIDAEGITFGNPGFRARRIEGKRLSTYIDCGMGTTAVPNADDYQVTMSVLTRLTATDDGGTMVVTTVDGSGRPRSVSGNPVHCQSKGELEMRVANLVLLALVQEGR